MCACMYMRARMYVYMHVCIWLDKRECPPRVLFSPQTVSSIFLSFLVGVGISLIRHSEYRRIRWLAVYCVLH